MIVGISIALDFFIFFVIVVSESRNLKYPHLYATWTFHVQVAKKEKEDGMGRFSRDVRLGFCFLICFALITGLVVMSGCATGNTRLDHAQQYGMTGAGWGAAIGALAGVASGTDPGRAAALGALIVGGMGATGGAIDTTPNQGQYQAPRYNPFVSSAHNVIATNGSHYLADVYIRGEFVKRLAPGEVFSSSVGWYSSSGISVIARAVDANDGGFLGVAEKNIYFSRYNGDQSVVFYDYDFHK